MSEREQERSRVQEDFPLSASGRRAGGGVNFDPRQERLREVFALADPPLMPSETLRRRVAEVVARQDAPVSRWRSVWPPVMLQRVAVARFAAAVLLLAVLGVAVARWSHDRSQTPSPPLIARRPLPDPMPLRWRPGLQQRGVDAGTPRLAPIRTMPPRDRSDWELGRRSPGRFASSTPPRVERSTDEWDAVEARVRRMVQTRDDFVQVPFPRLVSASSSAGEIAEAVESYKREAAIVDVRLSREVTLQQKGTALVDLCDRLRADTGIQLQAGSSVADEKVTVLCDKVPLRDVMRQLSRPFGYAWIRSGKAGEYKYELVQDLRSQLLEEELRNRDRNAALLSLEREIERFRPYLNLTPVEILARAKTAPPAEKKLLEKLGGGSPRSGLGWGPIQMYFRLSAQEKMALRGGETIYFSEGPRPGERPLPPDVARGVLQSWRFERALKVPDGYKIVDANDPDGIPISALPGVRAAASVWLRQAELGQYALGGLSGLYGPVFRGDLEGNYAVGMSPKVLQPENEAVNARLARDPALRPRVSIQPRPSCPPAVNEDTSPLGDRPLPLSAAGPRRGSPASPKRGGETAPRSVLGGGANPESKVTTADVLEALHRATGMSVVGDFYTRLSKPEAVSVCNMPLFDALNRLCDAMRLRWNKDGVWVQFRSTSYYDDRLKEVPNRFLARWAARRGQHGILALDDLVEIAQLSDAQLNGDDMAEGARECYGLREWDLARNHMIVGNLRFLAQFTPEQRQHAASDTGLPFTGMTLAQQQGFLAAAFPATQPGTGTPMVEGLQSLAELGGAVLRVDYWQPGWYEWRPLGPTFFRWIAPLELTNEGRHVLLPRVRERTREAALQALRRVDPQIRAALLKAAARVDPRIESAPPADEAQIVPTDLDLATIYYTGVTNNCPVLIMMMNSYSRG